MKKILLMLPVILFSLFGSMFEINANASLDSFLKDYRVDVILAEDTASEFALGFYGFHGEYISVVCEEVPFPERKEIILYMLTEDSQISELNVINGVTIYAVTNLAYLQSNYYAVDEPYFLSSYWDVLSHDVLYVGVENEEIIYVSTNRADMTGNDYSYYKYDSKAEVSDWYKVDYNFNGFTNSSNLNVTVDFTPDLTGNVSRFTVQNGVSVESNYFSMDITNNSSDGIQFLMAVVSQGEEIYFQDLPPIGNKGVPNSKGYNFLLIYPEWYYTLSNDPLSVDTIKVHGNFPWHYISKDETYHHEFSWSQFNLKKDVNYDVVVYALLNDIGTVSSINLPTDTSGIKEYIDFNKVECVYRSTFNLDNPAIYNPNDDSFNNVPNSSDIYYEDLFQYVTGIEDSGGNVDIGYFDKYNDYNSVNGNMINSNKDYNSTSLDYSLSSFLSSSQSFLSFLQACFNFFPAWLWSIICISFFTIIIIGLLRLLR